VCCKVWPSTSTEDGAWSMELSIWNCVVCVCVCVCWVRVVRVSVCVCLSVQDREQSTDGGTYSRAPSPSHPKSLRTGTAGACDCRARFPPLATHRSARNCQRRQAPRNPSAASKFSCPRGPTARNFCHGENSSSREHRQYFPQVDSSRLTAAQTRIHNTTQPTTVHTNST